MSQKINGFTPSAALSDVARIQFIIDAALSGMRTAIPVKVMSVSNNGGVSPIGVVSLKPLVQNKDNEGNALPHGIIHNCPYMRIQGGENAVIIDPQVGDIGMGIVCDRDISAVQNSAAEAPPGSSRKNDMSDMVYLMTIISKQTPTQYIQFNASGITVTSPNDVIINANNATINAPTTINGTLTVNGNVATTGTLTNNGVNVGSTHVHGGVLIGGSNTATPH